MTHLKPNKEDTDNQENTAYEEKEKGKPPDCCTERCIQSFACILLAFGLCTIIVSFYLVLQQKHWQKFNPNMEENSYDATPNIGLELIPKTDFVDDNNTDNWLDAKRNGRLLIEDIFGAVSSIVIGCQEKSCKIACSNEPNLFTTLYKTMKATPCHSIDIMLLESQAFHNDVLKNSWFPANRSVHEVIIRKSNFTRIKSNAFNSPMFAHTLLMTWSDLNIDIVSSGALLGLFKLKYLTVNSYIRILEPALFQPVQTTLTHLKLNGKLELKGNRNAFGSTHMTKLEYLDLSNNVIIGPLSKGMFSSTPNIKYLLIVNSQLESIKTTAFDRLKNTLIFLNLSKNLLTTFAPELLQAMVKHQSRAMVSLNQNKWLCDCNLRELSELYKNYRNQFMDAVYCAAPHKLYGISIDEVNYEQLECTGESKTTIRSPEAERISEQTENAKPETTKFYTSTPISDFVDSNDLIDSYEVTSDELSHVLKMRCVNDESITPTSASSSSFSSSPSSSVTSRSAESFSRSSDDAILKFPAPDHEFDLQLVPENNSVIISIENPSDLMIIWFSEQQQESQTVTFNDMSLDYECMRYAEPNLMVGPLVDNTTYTFCLIPRYQSSISPFNCLPLYVPLKRDENIWISQEKKHFTIGMLCLIFLVSTTVGALIAYYGIKTYPDLLEGSKNVLIVKKPEQECYVATISETEYLKHSFVTNQKASNKETTQSQKIWPKRLSLPPTPDSPSGCDSCPPSVHASLKNIESVSSGISSVTCFEDSFTERFVFPQDDYETPKEMGSNRQHVKGYFNPSMTSMATEGTVASSIYVGRKYRFLKNPSGMIRSNNSRLNHNNLKKKSKDEPKQLPQPQRLNIRPSRSTPTRNMVNEAFKTLVNEQHKSLSLAAIRNFIACQYKLTPDRLKFRMHFVKKYLNESIGMGHIKRVRGYGLSGSFKMIDKTKGKLQLIKKERKDKETSTTKKRQIEKKNEMKEKKKKEVPVVVEAEKPTTTLNYRFIDVKQERKRGRSRKESLSTPRLSVNLSRR